MALRCKETWNPRVRLNYCHQEPKFPGRYLDYFHTIGQEIRNWFRPNGHYASAMGRGGRYRSQMTHFLTWLPSWIFKPAMLMQQVGCSVVPGWPAQLICMSGVYSPIYSSSKWQWNYFLLVLFRIFSWAVRHSCRMSDRNQWQIQGRKTPNFGWATSGWASCILCPLCMALDLDV